jgi:hypothetical protein
MKIKTRVGNLIKVTNKNKRFNANEYYYSGCVKINGIIINILLTQDQVDSAVYRANHNPEDIVERSFVSRLID